MALVETRIDGPVGIMALNDGENRFNPPLVEAIHAALDGFEKNDAVRAVVITGTGKYFSNGLDLASLTKLSAVDRKKFIVVFQGMLRRIGIYPKPTIAAINGHAYAGGAMLASLPDFRYMRSDRGWVCLPEVDIQLPFWPGMIALLENAFSRARFRDVAYSGKKYTASELLQMKFLDGVYSEAELLPKCVEHAKALATKNIATYAEIKRRMNAEITRVFDEEDPKYFF